MTHGSRDAVLAAIRQALAVQPSAPLQLPPPWQAVQPAATKDDLAATFVRELRALGGEAFVVASRAACAAAIETYAGEHAVSTIALQSSPLAHEIGALLKGLSVTAARSLSVTDLERVDAGMIEARSFLADTGSALVLTGDALDRLLPYLPRTCIVVGEAANLHPSLSAEALAALDDAAQQSVRGEALIVTGPSRTADIEKTLVLGAHGPASLAVFLIGPTTPVM